MQRRSFEGNGPNIADVAPIAHKLLSGLREQHTIHSKVLEFAPFIGPGLPLLRPSPVQQDVQEPARPATASERAQRATAGQLPRHLEGYGVEVPGYRNWPTRPVNMPPLTLEPLNDGLDDEGATFIQQSFNHAIAKLEGYVKTLNENPVYWAAQILYPSLRKKWLDQNMTAEQVDSIIATFRELYDHEYSQLPIPRVEQPEQIRAPARHDFLYGSIQYGPVVQLAEPDEVGSYLSEPVPPTCGDPLL